jgi:hypothetical protein
MEIVEMFESIKSLSHELRLFGVHRSVERRCGEALADSLHPSELVRVLLQDEKDQRKEAAGKRLTTRPVPSRLRPRKLRYEFRARNN